MSLLEPDFTAHQLHGFHPQCEYCADQRPKQKKTNYEQLGNNLRIMAHNMEKITDIVKVLDEAKKNNPRGLIF